MKLSFQISVGIAIEESYTGPSLEDGNVTTQFMTDLMEWYKNQKVLHRRFAYKVTWNPGNLNDVLFLLYINMNEKCTITSVSIVSL